MNNINYFLLTEVKAKNISTVEKIANFCLKPAQYLWNGKKIDFIQELDQKAVQIDFIYNSKEHSWIKTALMVVLLIPGVLLGSTFKAYATCRHHVREDDVFMKKCLKKDVVGTILTPTGQSEFGKKIGHFISVLQSTGSWNSHLKDTSKPLFLSEIENMRLLYEEIHPSPAEGWCRQYAPEAEEVNRNILNNIHLLWNLSFINLADHYVSSAPRIEVSALKEINPSVISLQVEQLKFTKAVKAQDFFQSANAAKTNVE
jgi:hypothetical protein